MSDERPDVVILGAGLAGLSLARQLLLETERSVLLLERRDAVPPERQKVGESLVQLGGYYFSKVLDLEEHLFRRHFLKYNLRFHWPAAGDGSRYEDYSQSSIRAMSNVASYQLDRNVLEAELLARNLEDPRFTFQAGVRDLDVELAEGGPSGGPGHRVAYRAGGARREVCSPWVVDTTGRNRFLAKRMDLGRPSSIRHGSFYWWVDGLVDVERLTDASRREVRRRPERRELGHLPFWLATNHFCGEGFWFWVIPLQGKTSLGLVFDSRRVDPSEVFSVEKATRWICERFPLFRRDLPHREVLDFGGFRDFAYDCAQTIHPDGWALAGESGRFSDPLYSPASDLIAVHNTLIVGAVEAGDADELESRCALAEQLMRTMYSAYVPSYSLSYDTLGDQEVFSVKYAWELATYFATYVFPFVNDLLTDRRFALSYLRQVSRLGPVNRSLQGFLADFHRWKQTRAAAPGSHPPRFFDFTAFATLQRAESTFYRVGASVEEARRVLGEQVDGLRELARFIAAHAASVVLDDPRVVTSRPFVEGIDPEALVFDPKDFGRRWEMCSRDPARWEWSFEPPELERFRPAPEPAVVAR
ncbi:MAG: hypothetical protein ACLF0P_07835 [Thermoanaerobaculia bacterium]